MSAYRANLAQIDWTWAASLPEGRTVRSVQRSDLACPTIVSDAMPPTRSMADGRIYESKRACSAATRAAGLTEVGTEKLPTYRRPAPDRRAIKDTIERAAARVERGERA